MSDRFRFKGTAVRVQRPVKLTYYPTNGQAVTLTVTTGILYFEEAYPTGLCRVQVDLEEPAFFLCLNDFLTCGDFLDAPRPSAEDLKTARTRRTTGEDGWIGCAGVLVLGPLSLLLLYIFCTLLP